MEMECVKGGSAVSLAADRSAEEMLSAMKDQGRCLGAVESCESRWRAGHPVGQAAELLETSWEREGITLGGGVRL